MDIDEMKFVFMPGWGNTHATFILRQLQEKYLVTENNLYFAVVYLEKAFCLSAFGMLYGGLWGN